MLLFLAASTVGTEDFGVMVRRRLARVFSVCISQRAADGLLIGLEDLRFEVRYQTARSLLSLVEKNSAIRIDKERILALVEQEVAVNRQLAASTSPCAGRGPAGGLPALDGALA